MILFMFLKKERLVFNNKEKVRFRREVTGLSNQVCHVNLVKNKII